MRVGIDQPFHRLQSVSVLCVGTLAGCVGLHVLAGTACPAWARVPPQACHRVRPLTIDH